MSKYFTVNPEDESSYVAIYSIIPGWDQIYLGLFKKV